MDNKNFFDEDFDMFNASSQVLFENRASKKDGNAEDLSKSKTQNSASKEAVNNDNAKTAIEAETKKEDKNSSKTTDVTKHDVKDNKTDKSKDININDNTQETKEAKNLEENADGGSKEAAFKLQDKKVMSNTGKNKQIATDKKKAKNKKKRNIIIASCVVAFAVLAVVLGFVIHYIVISKKLDTPTFACFQRSTGTIFEIDEVSNAKGYEFVIASGGSETKFVVRENVVELGKYLSRPGQSTVKVRALGEIDKANSDFSDTQEIINYVKLETPKVFRTEDTLQWDAIKNAEGYRLYYGVDAENNAKYFEISTSVSDLVNFDLNSLYALGSGIYSVSVIAYANAGEYYLNSEFSEKFTIENLAKMQKPQGARYEQQKGKLHFYMDPKLELATSYELVISYADKVVKHSIFAENIECKQITLGGDIMYEYTVDLNEYIKDNFQSMTLKAIGQGEYSIDSDVVDVNLA